MQKVLILLASADDLKLVEPGRAILQDFRISHQLRVASAQLAPDYVKDMVSAFHKAGGRVIVCVASPQDRLASLVSTLCPLPVLHVAVGASAVQLDQLPGPLPVATLGMGAQGLTQAAVFCLQLLALQDAELDQNVQRYRHSLAAAVIAADHKHRVNFDV